MMNEKGIISLTALCIMLIISLMIAGVSNIAARQADITRYYKIENELQILADSYFNMMLADISGNFEKYKTMDFDTKAKVYSANVYGNEAKVTINIKKSKTHEKIIIMTLAELPSYNSGKYSVYKRVLGYISVRKKIDEEDSGEYEFNKFEGYIY